MRCASRARNEEPSLTSGPRIPDRTGDVEEHHGNAAAPAILRLGTDQPCRARSDIGRPSEVMRFSTRHVACASTRWLCNARAACFTPTSALNRDTAFSAMLCRVAPLEVRQR